MEKENRLEIGNRDIARRRKRASRPTPPAESAEPRENPLAPAANRPAADRP
ncbi:MAG: hypothetical protein WDA20_07480 [Desulfuromonadales bacterium]|jgi:hypothetical protein